MFNKVGTVSIYVQDQQRAKKFYTEVLGFELRTDAELWPGAPTRWISVVPQGAQTEIILYVPDENWEHYKGVVGKSQSITLDVTNIQQLVSDLKAKGVKFRGEIDVQPWGSSIFLEDSEGNSLLLVEQPKFS
jgi:lactoylglutathione lyase